MKKILTVLLLFLLFSVNSVYAEKENDVQYTIDTVTIVVDIFPCPANTESNVRLRLNDGNSDYECSLDFAYGDTEKTAVFQVPTYEAGKIFNLSLISGLESIQYYDKIYPQNEKFQIQTYIDIIDEMPSAVSTFHIHGVLESYKPIEYYKDFVPFTINPAPRYYDGTLYVPASEGAKSMGVSYIEYDAENGNITYWILDKQINMQVGAKNIIFFGQKKKLDAPVVVFDEIPYIPLLSFAALVDANVIIQNEPDHINAVVSDSMVVYREIKNKTANERINSTNISSDTNYLIWVNKAEYKVRVFEGSKNNWSLADEIPCAIGAPSSPTCTGTYKYYSKEKQWSYDSFYVGPIMRFNGGYAIHSTLLRYNGTPYDNRVGMKLSHGCVRLQPQDMNRLISYIPLYTTVYITEK